jgi:outer membrane immunogenic protein
MKQNLIAAVAAAALLGSPAMAADMALKAPPAPVAPAYSWTGFYLGGQVGYGWGTSFQEGADGFGNTGNFNTSGVLGGVTAGYNWQFNGNWVVGLETDFSGADINGTVNSSTTYTCGNAVGTPTPCYDKIDWFGTVRGRLGYAWNNVLLYGTGGWAYGRAEAGITGCPIFAGVGFCGSNDVSGWTAGGGIEYGLAPNWSIKAEYLHVDMGRFNFTTSSGCAGTGGCVSPAVFDLVRVGVNYHFNFGGPLAPPLVTK